MILDGIEIRQTYLLNKWVIAKMSKKDPCICNQRKEIDDKTIKAIASSALVEEYEQGNTELEIKTEKGIILVSMKLVSKEEKPTEAVP